MRYNQFGIYTKKYTKYIYNLWFWRTTFLLEQSCTSRALKDKASISFQITNSKYSVLMKNVQYLPTYDKQWVGWME